ncbi:hypothetical protein [Pelagibius sp.]|uniref:hypothetical protein n=1 Tax=Pelagibius sp. TaxID=1931238 RepID=UPI003B509B3B
MATQTTAAAYFQGGEINHVYSVVIPTILAVTPFASLAIGERFSFFQTWMVTERGMIEHATVLVAIVGFFLALQNFRLRAACPKPWFGPYAILFALGFVYIVGEEMSWGQHLVGWESSEWFIQANRQQETNFHNLHQSIDRLPKSILGAAVVISGVLVPLIPGLRRLQTASFNGHWPWLWPTPAVRTTAVLFFLVWIFDRGLVLTDLNEGEGYNLRFTELRELLTVYFLALYTGCLYHRLKDRENAA